jgi:hypothetical protein
VWLACKLLSIPRPAISDRFGVAGAFRRTWQVWLKPDTTKTRWLVGASGMFVLTVVGVAVMVVRKPDAMLVPQLWAEDGAVFLTDALVRGWQAAGTPYSGYLHLLPRLIAAASVLVPPAYIPAAFTAGAMTPVIIVAGLLASSRLTLTAYERVGCMLLLTLPPMPGEVLLNVTNVQWLLAFAFVLVLLANPPATTPSLILELAVLLLAGLTGPYSLIFAPFFAVRALRAPSRATVAAAATVAVAAAAQMAALLLTPPRPGDPVAVEIMATNFGRRIAVLMHYSISDDGAFVVFAVLVGIVVIGLAAMVLERSKLAWICFAAGIASFVAVMIGTRSVGYGLALGGERYFALSVGLVLWGVALAMRRFPRVAAVALGFVLAATAPALFVPPLPDLQWRARSACLSTAGPCSIPINPAGWSVVIADGAR